MARKNRKKKFREHHKKLLKREQKNMDKLAEKFDPKIISEKQN